MALPKLQAMTSVLAKQFKISPEELLASFRPAVESDLPAILEFRKKFLGAALHWNDENYFRWRFNFPHSEPLSNADSNSHPRNANRVWVFILNNQLLGILGCVQVPLQIASSQSNKNFQTIEATHPLDVLVDQSIDGLGVGAWMQFVFNEATQLMLVIGANENSSSIVKRIFHRMPDRQVWKLAISSYPILHRKLHNHTWAKAIGWLSDCGMVLFRAARHALYANQSLTFKSIEKFQPDINAVSESWIGKANLRLRTADYLNWRFFENPNKSYEAFLLSEGTTPVAYLIFHRQTYMDTKYVFVDDFCWLLAEKSDVILFTLWDHLIAWARSQAIDILIVHTYGQFARRALRRHRFIERGENLLISMGCNVPELEQTIYNPDAWFITAADAHGAGI